MPRILLSAASVALFLLLLAAVDSRHLRFLIAGATGTGCPEGERKQIELTIKTYNKILADFYASGGNPGLINHFPATKQIKHEIFRDLGYVKSADRVLVYDLATLTPYRITLTGPGRAEAQFFEEWNFMYQNLDRTPKTKPLGFGRGFRYHLVKEKGQWLVQDWDPDSTVPDLGTKEFKF